MTLSVSATVRIRSIRTWLSRRCGEASFSVGPLPKSLIPLLYHTRVLIVIGIPVGEFKFKCPHGCPGGTGGAANLKWGLMGQQHALELESAHCHC
jgi:hypothetical protein